MTKSGNTNSLWRSPHPRFLVLWIGAGQKTWAIADILSTKVLCAAHTHTYLLSRAANSTSSNCFIWSPTSEVMFSALTWLCEMICREQQVSIADTLWTGTGWGGQSTGGRCMLEHGAHQR